jgi:hypothetical protein
MSIPPAGGPVYTSTWNRFWHEPVRAERLALMRILLALALLGDQLLQYWPNFAEFYGPEGVAPAGLYDQYQYKTWRVTYFFFGTDDLGILQVLFWVWVAVTVLFLVGWHTRLANVAVWLLTRCFIERNPVILTSGDDVALVALALLALAPSGHALSVDAWLRRRRGHLVGPALVPPWSLRLIQIQLCLILCTTGLLKLKGEAWLQSTWWDGTSLHYYLNDTTMWRRSYAQLPVPIWITRPMTYFTVWWEALFPLLVMVRRTRFWALLIGIIFHAGIFLTAEVGWFGCYMLTLYAVWIPDRFWEWRKEKAV